MTEKIFNSEAELAKKLIITACGLVTIDQHLQDSLDKLFSGLASRNKRWTRRRVRSLYYFEGGKIHFDEVMDLLALVREQDEATYQTYMSAIIHDFVSEGPSLRVVV